MTGVHGGDAPAPTAADEAFATPADIGLHQRFLLPSKSPSWTCWMAVERLTVEIARRLQPAEEARVDLRCDPILARAGNAEPALVRPRNGSCSRRLSFLPFREILKAYVFLAIRAAVELHRNRFCIVPVGKMLRSANETARHPARMQGSGPRGRN